MKTVLPKNSNLAFNCLECCSVEGIKNFKFIALSKFNFNLKCSKNIIIIYKEITQRSNYFA